MNQHQKSLDIDKKMEAFLCSCIDSTVDFKKDISHNREKGEGNSESVTTQSNVSDFINKMRRLLQLSKHLIPPNNQFGVDVESQQINKQIFLEDFVSDPFEDRLLETHLFCLYIFFTKGKAKYLYELQRGKGQLGLEEQNILSQWTLALKTNNLKIRNKIDVYTKKKHLFITKLNEKMNFVSLKRLQNYHGDNKEFINDQVSTIFENVSQESYSIENTQLSFELLKKYEANVFSIVGIQSRVLLDFIEKSFEYINHSIISLQSETIIRLETLKILYILVYKHLLKKVSEKDDLNEGTVVSVLVKLLNMTLEMPNTFFNSNQMKSIMLVFVQILNYNSNNDNINNKTLCLNKISDLIYKFMLENNNKSIDTVWAKTLSYLVTQTNLKNLNKKMVDISIVYLSTRKDKGLIEPMILEISEKFIKNNLCDQIQQMQKLFIENINIKRFPVEFAQCLSILINCIILNKRFLTEEPHIKNYILVLQNTIDFIKRKASYSVVDSEDHLVLILLTSILYNHKDMRYVFGSRKKVLEYFENVAFENIIKNETYELHKHIYNECISRIVQNVSPVLKGLSSKDSSLVVRYITKTKTLIGQNKSSSTKHYILNNVLGLAKCFCDIQHINFEQILKLYKKSIVLFDAEEESTVCRLACAQLLQFINTNKNLIDLKIFSKYDSKTKEFKFQNTKRCANFLIFLYLTEIFITNKRINRNDRSKIIEKIEVSVELVVKYLLNTNNKINNNDDNRKSHINKLIFESGYTILLNFIANSDEYREQKYKKYLERGYSMYINKILNKSQLLLILRSTFPKKITKNNVETSKLAFQALYNIIVKQTNSPTTSANMGFNPDEQKVDSTRIYADSCIFSNIYNVKEYLLHFEKLLNMVVHNEPLCKELISYASEKIINITDFSAKAFIATWLMDLHTENKKRNSVIQQSVINKL